MSNTVIKTATSSVTPEAVPAPENTAALDAEAVAAAEMAAQAQQSQEEELKPALAKPAVDGENPDDSEAEWAEFIEDDEDELLPDAAKAKPVETIEETPIVEEVVPAPVVEEPPAVEEPEVVPVEEVSAAEEIPAVEEPPVVEEVKPQETRTPEEVTAAIKDARDNAHKTLREQYLMTEDQEETFRENPKEVLANLAADMYLDMFDSMMSAVQQQVPQMIQQITVQNNQRMDADKAFFGEWPQLVDAKYRQTIDRIAQTYRAMNPSTSNEQAIKEIGAQAWVALRLPMDQLLAHTSGKPQEVTTTPPAPAPVQTPASPGNASTSQREVVIEEVNEYTELANEFIEEDANER